MGEKSPPASGLATRAATAEQDHILAGFHAVGARLRSDPSSIEVLYFDGNRHDGRMRQILARAAAAAVRSIAVPAERLHGLSPQTPHQGLVARVHARTNRAGLEDVLAAVRPETLLLVLDGVTDPRNLGACLRTAAAAAVDAVIVPRDRSASLTAVATKAAAGAADTVPLISVTNLARAMKDMQSAGIWIVGADTSAEHSLYDVDLTGPRAWALGAEGSGLRRLTRERCDTLVHIPMAAGMESLNVSVAAGVCLFETQRQRRQKGVT
ncbi:MAG TPA: 23S rRNA (guanosine(2251)-2'-O)-methyltransferase RlmB [Burkholderiaceae bacterium]|nr:23S rRNA (guanosine(2251)-2'-O)-methyltransferase RlmB [Burkholderiaceae bacterium]